MAAVDFHDLELAFEFVSSGRNEETRAYVSLDTGRIYWFAEDGRVADEDAPEDLETSDRYVPVPHQRDLDLGSRLALAFAAEELPRRYREVEDCFRRRGAYGQFRAILQRAGCLEKWHNFEAEATEKALRAWCAENGLEVTGAATG